VASLIEVPIEVLDLGHGARIPIQQEAGHGVLLVQPVIDQRVGDLIGDIAASGGNRHNLAPELGTGLDVRAEDVTRGDRRNAVVLGDPGGLSALAGTWRAEDEEAH